MAAKLSRWAIFSVLVSLFPLIYSYFNLLVKSKPANIDEILSTGELLILVSAMCAGAIGEIIGSKHTLIVPKIIAAGLTILILMMSVSEFASVSEGRISAANIDLIFIRNTSLSMFVFAVVICACCIALSEM